MASRLFNWIEIDRSALVSNLAGFRDRIKKDCALMPMVKANAYGHGLLETTGVVSESGADWLGVHSLEEGAALRDAGATLPILVVGYVPIADLEEALRRDLRLTIYNLESVIRLADICRKSGLRARCHIKLETGTNRQGVSAEEAVTLAGKIGESAGLELEGVSSHYANIEDTTDHSYARFQLGIFRKALAALEAAGFEVPVRHFSCSAAALLFPETHFDMVRIGIGMYGLWPSRETYVSCLQAHAGGVTLRPVLSWKARVAQIKSVSKGARIGYGGTFKTGRASRLAVVPVGYYDGYSRSLSNVSHVLIRGERAPLRGRVAMNFFVVDVTDIPGVELEEEVILIGSSGNDCVTAEDLAAWEGTISYEVLARLNPGIPRIVVPGARPGADAGGTA
jgi:alanine racemase